MENNLKRRTSVLQEFSKERPPLALMDAPPHDPIERDRIGNEIWMGIVLRFEARLSEPEKSLLRNPPADPKQSSEYKRLVHLFDDYLLSQFADFGWKLLMSRDVLDRVAIWESERTELVERLGRELVDRSRVFRGDKSAGFGERLEDFADKAVEQLHRLLSRLRDEFGKRNVLPTCERIAAWMKLEIESDPERYPELLAELPQLVGWVESLPSRNSQLAKTLVRCDMRAQGFFNQWYAACSHRSPRDVQNQISRRRALRARK
jgi:hypothetical protein